MAVSARLRVVVDGKVVAQGTAFPCEDYIVTAFHVVGAREDGSWRHDLQHGVRYLLALDRDVELTAVIADSGADIALLKASEAIFESRLPLAVPSDIDGRPWRTVGFPINVGDREYALDGTVTYVGESWWSAQALQLLVSQGTRVPWNGISGGPVIIDGRVAGVLTECTPDSSTLWACSVGSVRRLISAARSNCLAEAVAVLSADNVAAVGAVGAELLPRSIFKAVNFPTVVKLLECVTHVPDVDGLRRVLERMDVENGPPKKSSGPMILLPRNSWNTLSTPDLLTPAGSSNRSELRALYGETAGDELAILSEHAIGAIEDGDFDGYIDIGQAIQRKGREVAALKIVQDGESLVADGYRLLAGMRPAVGESYLRIAIDGFDELLDVAPDNVRALRGRACCSQARHNYGDALQSYDLAIESIQRHLASRAGTAQSPSRRLGDRHELLRLLRHRTEVILLIRRGSPQSRWNTEIGKLQFSQHVDEHQALFRRMMPLMTTRAGWYDFESFASHVFMADALHELGNVGKAAHASVGALRHRRRMISSASLTDIQCSNLRWWLRSSRKALSAHSEVASNLDDLEQALLTRHDGRVLDYVDRVLEVTHAWA